MELNLFLLHFLAVPLFDMFCHSVVAYVRRDTTLSVLIGFHHSIDGFLEGHDTFTKSVHELNDLNLICDLKIHDACLSVIYAVITGFKVK